MVFFFFLEFFVECFFLDVCYVDGEGVCVGFCFDYVFFSVFYFIVFGEEYWFEEKVSFDFGVGFVCYFSCFYKVGKGVFFVYGNVSNVVVGSFKIDGNFKMFIWGYFGKFF